VVTDSEVHGLWLGAPSDRMLASKLPAQVVAVCGKNPALKAALDKIASRAKTGALPEPGRLETMRKNALSLGRTDAGAMIAGFVAGVGPPPLARQGSL
jgi:hypothetical protein